MNEKLSRRAVLQAALTTGIGAAGVTYAAGAVQVQAPAQMSPLHKDPYVDLLHRYGGEMGGRKPPR
jgi:hypothetical protein